VTQNNIDQNQAAETPTQETKTFIRQVKIRIVLEGFRREVTVSDLCRREGIKPGVFYACQGPFGKLRGCFMEAGKERPTGDTVRDATRQEIEHLKRENHDGRVTTEESRRKSHDLKQLVADPSLEVRRFKRTALPAFDGAERPGEV